MRNQPRPNRDDFISTVNLAILHARRAKADTFKSVKWAIEHLSLILDLVNHRPDAWDFLIASGPGQSVLISAFESLNLIVYHKKVKALLRKPLTWNPCY